jgi:hypothetical protein
MLLCRGTFEAGIGGPFDGSHREKVSSPDSWCCIIWPKSIDFGHLTGRGEKRQKCWIFVGAFQGGFWPPLFRGGKLMKVGLYSRVSTHDQQTLPLQVKAMRAYARKRKWMITMQVK